MKRLTRYQIDFDYTLSYVLYQLEGYTSLSKLFYNEFKFEKGSFFVDLPEDSQLQRVYAFQSGGMTPQFDCGLEKELTKEGKEFTPKCFLSTDSEMSRYIHQLLSSNICKMALFDEMFFTREVHEESVCDVPVHYNGNEVYYAATSESTLDEVDSAFSRGNKMWRTFGIMLDAEIKPSDEFIRDNRTLLLDHTRYVICGVYDGEAHVVWEKNVS